MMNTPKTPREAGEAAFYECEGNTLACLKAAFDAYEAAAASGWLPIDSAPKDGRTIWAYLYNSGIRAVRWEGDPSDIYETGWVEVFDETEMWSPRWWLPFSSIPAAPRSWLAALSTSKEG